MPAQRLVTHCGFGGLLTLLLSRSSSIPAQDYESYRLPDAGHDTETHHKQLNNCLHRTRPKPEGCSKNIFFFSLWHLPFSDRSKLRSSSQMSAVAAAFAVAAAWPVRLLLLRDVASLLQSWWKTKSAHSSPNLKLRCGGPKERLVTVTY